MQQCTLFCALFRKNLMTKHNHSLTVITVVKNDQENIEKTIKSVISNNKGFKLEYIVIDGKSIELPVLESTEGLNVVDVRGLINEGVFTYDPGFTSTAACNSKIVPETIQGI